ncbi:MAG: hypothetical protein V2I56_02360 [Desulfobacteraceae bacterium]|jgi:hypothetical protein|nr:hypothetical protein [Desulfobacteraceae bacterium]
MVDKLLWFNHRAAIFTSVSDCLRVSRFNFIEFELLVARSFKALRAIALGQLDGVNCQVAATASQLLLRLIQNRQVGVGAIFHTQH